MVATGWAEPWAQFGTQLSTSEVPCPTAPVADQELQAMCTTTFVPSPLKKIVRGRIPVYEPALSTGNEAAGWVGTTLAVTVVTDVGLEEAITVLVAVTVWAAWVEVGLLDPQAQTPAAMATHSVPALIFPGSPRIMVL